MRTPAKSTATLAGHVAVSAAAPFASSFEASKDAAAQNGTGAYAPSPTAGVFYISETALLGMVVLLAKELGTDGIRVNAVAPGPVRTRFASDLWVGDAEDQNAKSRFLGRIGEPEDIAGAVAFICSDDAGWYTGQTMSIDGGAYSRL